MKRMCSNIKPQSVGHWCRTWRRRRCPKAWWNACCLTAWLTTCWTSLLEQCQGCGKIRSHGLHVDRHLGKLGAQFFQSGRQAIDFGINLTDLISHSFSLSHCLALVCDQRVFYGYRKLAVMTELPLARIAHLHTWNMFFLLLVCSSVWLG